ncbi:discoidin domain-containing protein [Fibrella aquatilis]|uniref:Discoidin domain-containing protein n=1 Tax=Fibrella aquatilis TaxID=2817059 RepID=A0A939G1Y3_9BACT|nr:discoidin domain-containing protein [Fibrella aquatilis]MBO0930376.1 discoidin domain-containing protein [Fibrella aquatilis]
MKLSATNILIGFALVALLAVGAGLWLSRRKDPLSTDTTVVRNIAPEATLTTSSQSPYFTNAKSILAAAIPTPFKWGDGGWNDASELAFPDWVELNWPTLMRIQSLTIVGLDAAMQPGKGADGPYGLKDFTVQAWVNGAWSTVVTVTGNTKDMTTHTLSTPVTAQKLRISITDSVDHAWSRIVQLQVQGSEA